MVWEALVQSQVRFNRVPEKVSGKAWEALVQSQVRFRLWSTGFWRRFRRRSGRLWCRAGQVQQGRFPEKVWEALVQSQVRFNRVSEMFVFLR
jgi:hypothetical protein